MADHNIIHVFSEKIYMPHIYEVYQRFSEDIQGKSIIRLLGGDRQDIEKRTQNRWNTIVDQKGSLSVIAEMIRDMLRRNIPVVLYVNNHFEGSAPLTIRRLESFLE